MPNLMPALCVTPYPDAFERRSSSHQPISHETACTMNVFSFRGSFQKRSYIYCLLVHAPTSWTQTRKPRTVTTLATGRWTNGQDNSYHGTQKKKKERNWEVKKKQPLPLFDWQVYPKKNVQLLNMAPWPNDEPCFCPGPPTSAWFETSTVFITVETASTMAVSHTLSSTSRGSSRQRKNRCFDAGLVSFGAAWPTTIRW